AEVEIRYVVPVGPDGERGRFCQLRKDYFDPPASPIHLRDLCRTNARGQVAPQPERPVALRRRRRQAERDAPPGVAADVKLTQSPTET
ncbi:hypothetical protein ABZT49_29120, partial [Methylobacterium sp. EM32]|uniref:hypothetical protein n=1 Tax=Methylobacterium sp. EM32 TaxID=3163481 RepID=UPI0033A2E843